MLEAEVNLSRPRTRPTFWPRERSGFETLTPPNRGKQGKQVSEARRAEVRDQKGRDSGVELLRSSRDTRPTPTTGICGVAPWHTYAYQFLSSKMAAKRMTFYV